MQYKNSWCLALILLFSFNLVSAVRINEVMPHSNNSLGNEWIELYNENEFNVSLVNWKIGDKTSNDTITLNISAKSYGIVTDSGIGCNKFNVSIESCTELVSIGSGLNDDDEFIYLYNSSLLTEVFSWNTSLKSSGNSWQNYEDIWQACNPTPGLANWCEPIQVNNTINQTQNNDSNDDEVNDDIYLRLDFENVVYSNDTIDIQVKAYNLKNKKYDIKVYLSPKGNTSLVSETYSNGQWDSSNNYVNNITSGPGNKTKIIQLRLKQNYVSFQGTLIVSARIRENNKDAIIAEREEEIEVIKRTIVEDEIINEPSIPIIQTVIGGEIISLNNPKDIKTSEIWKSNTSHIKDYGVYSFILLCVILVILLIIKRLP